MGTASLAAACSVHSASSCILVLPPADAQKTGGTPPSSASGSFVLPAGSVFGECAFDVRVALAGKGSTINLPGGRVILTSPGLHATLTNLNDPMKSVTLN